MKKRIVLLVVCANVLFATTQANVHLEQQAIVLVNALEERTGLSTQAAAQYRSHWASVLQVAKSKRPDITILPFLHNAIISKRDALQVPQVSNMHTDLLGLINIIRQEHGLTPLVYNTTLNIVAQSYATYMHTQNHFSHIGLDGQTFVDRVDASGYTYALIGENIARGYNDTDSVVGGWMNSPTHKANILDPAFVHMGLGRTGNYRVQLFGNPE